MILALCNVTTYWIHPLFVIFFLPVPDKQGKTNKLHPCNVPIVDGEIPMLDVFDPYFHE